MSRPPTPPPLRPRERGPGRRVDACARDKKKRNTQIYFFRERLSQRSCSFVQNNCSTRRASLLLVSTDCGRVVCGVWCAPPADTAEIVDSAPRHNPSFLEISFRFLSFSRSSTENKHAQFVVEGGRAVATDQLLSTSWVRRTRKPGLGSPRHKPHRFASFLNSSQNRNV